MAHRHFVCLENKVSCLKLQQLGCAVPGRSYSPTSALSPYLPESADHSPELSFLLTGARHSSILLEVHIGRVDHHNAFQEIINICSMQFKI